MRRDKQNWMKYRIDIKQPVRDNVKKKYTRPKTEKEQTIVLEAHKGCTALSVIDPPGGEEGYTSNKNTHKLTRPNGDYFKYFTRIQK